MHMHSQAIGGAVYVGGFGSDMAVRFDGCNLIGNSASSPVSVRAHVVHGALLD